MQLSFRTQRAIGYLHSLYGENGPLTRFAEHQQGDEPDYQKDEKENLGDSHGRACDASKTQQSGDNCDD